MAESKEQQLQTSKERAVEYVEPDDGRLIAYSNNIQLGTTAFDIRLLFGELLEVTDDKFIIEQRVQVTMSWLQAKQMMELLQKHIQAFEAKNGVLDVTITPP